jgi:hypothetical protein
MKSDARDQRDRQQFHEAKIFDAVQAPVFTGSIDGVPLRALTENIEIGASREVPKAATQDDRAATAVSRQVRSHIDSHKTRFACSDHRERLLHFSLGGWIDMEHEHLYSTVPRRTACRPHRRTWFDRTCTSNDIISDKPSRVPSAST